MENIVSKLKNENMRKILVVGHISPDGDAIGSSVGIAKFLKNIGKEAYVYLEDIPETFNFLLTNVTVLNSDEMLKKISEINQIIFVDGGEASRFPNVDILLSSNAEKICIDHHVRCGQFVDNMYVEEDSPSATQIIYKILKQVSKDALDTKVMQALITGLITDTGGFKYSSTNADSFTFAKNAYLKGVDIAEIFEKIEGEIPISQLKIENIALGKIKYSNNGKIASTIITLEEEKACNTKVGETERIVAQVRNIQGVEVAIFVREIEGGYKISLRKTSKCKVKLNEIAKIYGGGGHVSASGITIKNPEQSIDELLENIINDIQKKLD